MFFIRTKLDKGYNHSKKILKIAKDQSKQDAP